MKKLINVFKIFMIFVLLLLITTSNVYAKPDTKDVIEDMADAFQSIFIEGDIWGAVSKDYNSMMDVDIETGTTDIRWSSASITRRVLGVLQTIGSAVSVIALAIIGVRYMLSSVQEKAEMKGILIYYIVGAVLVFATSNIIGIAYDLITGIKMPSI